MGFASTIYYIADSLGRIKPFHPKAFFAASGIRQDALPSQPPAPRFRDSRSSHRLAFDQGGSEALRYS